MASRRKPAPKEKVAPPPFSGAQQLLCAGFVVVAALTIYVRTLAPTVTLVDSGELILAAHSLGIAHPPGFPLYLLLAHLASIVPIGNVAERVNFASAVFGALAAGMLTMVVSEICLTDKRNRSEPGLRLMIPAISSGLVIAFSRTLWFYSTIAEVYSLNALLILTVVFLMLRWRRQICAARPTEAKSRRDARPAIRQQDSWLLTAAAVFGLALGDHHVTVASILPGIALLVVRTEGLKLFASRRLLYAAVVSFAALVLIYSYLPLASSRHPIFDWGEPRSFAGVWKHLTGWQYQAFLSFNPQTLTKELTSFFQLIIREFGVRWMPVTLVVVLAGAWASFKHDGTIFWFFGCVIFVNTAYNLTYSIAEDKDAYYLPTFICCAVFAGLGIYSLGIVLLGSMRRLTLPAVGLLLPAIAFSANYRYEDRSHYFIARDYVSNMQRTVATDGLLLTQDWQVQSPMLYTREIEGARRDIKVVDINLLRRSWYFDYLSRAYPEMVQRSRLALDAFVSELKKWEKDPRSYAENAASTNRISVKFIELLRSFVRQELAVAPVYLTSDVMLSAEPESRSFAKWLTESFSLVPNGLVFELQTDRAFHDPGELQLETRGLTDGTLRFDDDDVVRQKVLPAYTLMLTNRGRYLAAFDQYERATQAFQRALILNPQLPVAEEGLKMSLAKLHNP